ncbi:LysR family transcriptional regulator [Bosea sp. 62]|uniref:LysR family transcriptional regulator n=1 Tax=unclassified Bosea (in: a-proteobacteria) TaxID=2653178 RepID=UPI001250F66D|nr:MULTISPECIES: LysR family transcriptional regulator [unclassified Bosea (in: a-proteobacteria)]CAD5254730.1 LysR family transcriptional regulator [Bosea sp. 21B]CAD5285679.1 LysR family transcriptional regulator [Bosea sp. 7B]CAD5301479.1 LysR family transcriptional regulator [Bosea sp. 46]VVT57586.1 LysR family transcriptional regulator [Bosea sp. EC-HK365B]VXB71323.1 LysR family transcriptional regulator [Bosea sp. 125]
MPTPTSSVAWDDFRLIKAIAEARSLPAAAELIGLNHSTVFRRLGQIEESLGTRLFERHRSGYVPTPAGEEMAVLAERLETDIAGFTRRLAGREILPAGELRVTTNDSLLVELLTPLFAAFMRQCPDIKLDVLLGNQALNLSKRDADVAIRATDNPPENLIGRRVAQIGWALYGRAIDFPEGAPAELTQQRWISLGDQFSNFKVVLYRQKHIPADQTVYKLNTVLGLAEAVEAGIGIGFLPCFIADKRPALVRLAPPQTGYAADLWLLTHPDLRHSPRVRLFLDFMAAELAKLRPLMEGGAGLQSEAGASVEGRADQALG